MGRNREHYEIEQCANPFRAIRFIPFTERFAVEGLTFADFPTIEAAQQYRDNYPNQKQKGPQQMIDTIEVPYPEIEQQNADKSIRQQFLELQAREAAEALAAQNARLDQINTSGDLSSLKTDMSLRIKFVERFGSARFGELNLRFTQAQAKAKRDAELAQRQSKREVSTTQGRLDALNKQRKAAASN